MGLIKYAAAKTNMSLGLLDRDIAEAIMRTSLDLANGSYDELVVVDVYQTGSGTGLNMNINEIIASKASELIGKNVHPNDHVNMGQSSNDVVPSAIRIAAVYAVERRLIPSLEDLLSSLKELVDKTRDVIKPGRTHLRDALPVTMGQEFSAYLDALERDLEILKRVIEYVKELPIGGTAVGTGINTHPLFGELVVSEINSLTGLGLRVAKNRFRAMRLLTDLVYLSSVFRGIALNLMRLGQDIRLMFSGPFTGIYEIDIEQEIPGSSIMPGKTNPVTIEAIMQAMTQIIGLDASIAHANTLGEFELSMGIPLVGYSVIKQIDLLTEASSKFSRNVVKRIRPLRERARELAEKSQALVTIISPVIGYDKATELSKKIMSGYSLRQALRELGYSDEEINEILRLDNLVKPGYVAKKKD